MARPPIDIIGKKIGTWTMVGYFNKHHCELICECGNTRTTDSHTIRHSSTLRCDKCIDIAYIGLRFGKWVSLGKSEYSENGKIKLKCRCKCGTISHISITSLRAGRSNGCKTCLADNRRIPNGAAIFNALFSQYRRQAKNRNIEWGLTKEQFTLLIKSNCYYTGLPPSSIRKRNGGQYIYNGIDRLDDTKGYYIDNCVPCIGDINMMKRSMEYSKFIQLCSLVVKHFEAEGINPINKLKAV